MIALGTYSEKPDRLFSVDAGDLLYHTAVIGQSGSGKSYLLARLLEEVAVRTSARIVILDPNGDFSTFYIHREEKFWSEGEHSEKLSNMAKIQSDGNFDAEPDFVSAWTKVKFQFLVADGNSAIPYSANAPAAPLKLHWKQLQYEQDQLLSDTGLITPKVAQGIATCSHYINDSMQDFRDGAYLEDLENIAGLFATNKIVASKCPESSALDETDWLVVRNAFRSVRKTYSRLWHKGPNTGKVKGPNGLLNYVARGYLDVPAWQVMVLDLAASVSRGHMHLAVDAVLSNIWWNARRGWERVREKKAAELKNDHSADWSPDTAVDELADETDGSVADGPSQDNATEEVGDLRLPTFIVIDEAQNFAPDEPTSPLQKRISDRIATIAAEGRKFGLFLVLATQRPNKLRRGLLAECENAALLRVQSKPERQHAADQLGMPETLVEQVVTRLPQGTAFIHGRWVQGATTVAFAPARTNLGGGGIDRKYWQVKGPQL